MNLRGNTRRTLFARLIRASRKAIWRASPLMLEGVIHPPQRPFQERKMQEFLPQEAQSA
jgi:hypothetical protein